MNSSRAQGPQLSLQATAFRPRWTLLAWRTHPRLLGGLLAVIALAALAPFFIPASLLVPRVERLASEALEEPVRIGGARLFLLPWPHVTLRAIAVGKQPFLEVDKLSVTPRITSLLAERMTLRSVELSGVTARQPLFSRLERWSGSGTAGSGAASAQVQRIRVTGADLRLASANLLGIDADVRLAPGNAVSSVLIRIDGSRVVLALTPDGADYAVQVAARNWSIPVAGFAVASFDARGRLTASGLDLPVVEGRFYGGNLAGRLALSWKADWKLAGRLELKDVDLKPIAAVYSKKTPISGRLGAVAAIDMRAQSAAALAAQPNIAVDFEVKDGVLHGIDIAAAAKLLPGKEEVKAGDTRFDRFSGRLLVDAEGFHFTGLEIASGVLDAQGYVSISPRQELSGRMEASVKGTGSLVGTPLALSGTVESPRVLPTKGTMAGAAAGTLLLGPGVGTTIGMKAAQFTERLFGKKPPKPKEPALQPATSTNPPARPATSAKPDAETQTGRR